MERDCNAILLRVCPPEPQLFQKTQNGEATASVVQNASSLLNRCFTGRLHGFADGMQRKWQEGRRAQAAQTLSSFNREPLIFDKQKTNYFSN